MVNAERDDRYFGIERRRAMKTTRKPLPDSACGESRLCLHISSGQFRAPKVCMLNRECFHCAYDQWLDYMKSDKQIESDR